MDRRPPPPDIGRCHRAALLSALVVTLIAATGCTFNTVDLARPLVPRKALLDDGIEETLISHFPAAEPGAIRRSLRKTRSALRYYGIHKYADSPTQLEIGQLADALELFPDNPFAWMLLGSYLGINYRPHEALEATRRAVQLTEELAANPRLEPLLAELHTSALLNLATFGSLTDDPRQALAALDKLQEERLGDLERIAALRLQVQALAAVGEVQAAQEALTDLRSLDIPPPSPRQSSLRFDFPQYFDANKVAAVNDYLQGLIDLHAERFDSALGSFQAAVAQYPELWEAHYSMANALSGRAESEGPEAAEADLAEARAKLKWLLDEIPSNWFYRRDLLYFSLGNVCFQQGAHSCAGTQYYEAINAFETVNRELRASFALRLDLSPSSPARPLIASSIEASYDPQSDRYIFGEAYNNLGNLARKRSLESHGLLRKLLLQRAEHMYQTALRDNRYSTPEVAQLNLAQLYLDTGDLRQTVVAAAHALQLQPLSLQGIQVLREASALAGGSATAARGYYVLLDHLEQISGGGALREAILAEVGEKLPAMEAGEDRMRLEARLLEMRGEAARAAELYQRAATAFNESEWPWAGLVRSATGRGATRPATLMEWLDRGIETGREAESQPWITTDRRFLLLSRGEMALQEGAPQVGIEYFQRALAISPHWPAAERALESAQLDIIAQDEAAMGPPD